MDKDRKVKVCLQVAASEPRLRSPATQEVVAQGMAASGVLAEGRYLTRRLKASPDFFQTFAAKFS